MECRVSETEKGIISFLTQTKEGIISPTICKKIFISYREKIMTKEQRQRRKKERRNKRKTKTFRVETPVSVALVKGTKFAVVVNPSGVDQFYGMEGLVEIMNLATFTLLIPAVVLFAYAWRRGDGSHRRGLAPAHAGSADHAHVLSQYFGQFGKELAPPHHFASEAVANAHG